MSWLVSTPAALAVEDILAGTAPNGVVGAPRDSATIGKWLAELEKEGLDLQRSPRSDSHATPGGDSGASARCS